MKYGYVLIGYREVGFKRAIALCRSCPPRYFSGLDAQHAAEAEWDRISPQERLRLVDHEIRITQEGKP